MAATARKKAITKKAPLQKATRTAKSALKVKSPKKSTLAAAVAPKRPAAKKSAAKEAPEVAAPSRVSSLTRQMVAAAVAACDEKKAEEIRLLELDAADAGFTDFFLIASGANARQTQSIADEVELRLKREFATYPNSVEGKRLGEWILLDYVDFVVHIFLAERRAFYDIERLRKSARPVDTAELQSALKEKTASTRKRAANRAALM